ncbi:hypothetical protein ACQKWADRAFT_293716 [Trichoderma austrokoningii]
MWLILLLPRIAPINARHAIGHFQAVNSRKCNTAQAMCIGDWHMTWTHCLSNSEMSRRCCVPCNRPLRPRCCNAAQCIICQKGHASVWVAIVIPGSMCGLPCVARPRLGQPPS